MDCNAAWAAFESDRPVEAGLLERAGRHVEHCTACQAKLDRNALPAGTLERHRAPSGLAARVGAALDGVSRGAAVAERKTAWRRFGALAASLLIGAVLGAGVATRLQGPGAQHDVIEQAVSGHVGAQLGNRLTQVASSEQHTVRPWFAGRIDLAPPVRDLSADGFVLQGGRLDYLERRPVAVVVYLLRKHNIDVFVRPTTDTDRAARVSSDRGYNTVSWTSGGFAFVAVSDLNAKDLTRFQASYAGQ
jgi:anti-sigma factor RsiW